MYLFSKETLAFYPVVESQLYIDAGTLPDDVIEVSEDVRNVYNAQPPAGKKLAVNKKGMPVWADMSHAELMERAEVSRGFRITDINNLINSRRWQSKLTLGRLSESESAMLSACLDYLDALEAVDVSLAPDINWPDKPEI
ncbi:tail fiber assembly protein [Cedecea neteri]|uniref:tail fiber assembly protein n=1 Tax=Cedecea neteri TaxID=158822 RepID=UPI002892B59C|nr:tail fiber assembly protein [Cedecea neteri]WNJ80519.1 tail fiber assembly protein [Cedecea neteri]